MKTLLLILFILNFSTFQSLYNPSANAAPTAVSEQLAAIYTAELGVREATGKNDGYRVEEYLRYVGLKRGDPWCAAFICWVLGQADIANPRSGYSPTLFPSSKVIWKNGPKSINSGVSKPDVSPRKGDVFGIFFPEKNRIAHVGFIDHWDNKYLITVEGNTNESGSREGDGVYRKRRLISSIFMVARYDTR